MDVEHCDIALVTLVDFGSLGCVRRDVDDAINTDVVHQGSLGANEG